MVTPNYTTANLTSEEARGTLEHLVMRNVLDIFSRLSHFE